VEGVAERVDQQRVHPPHERLDPAAALRLGGGGWHKQRRNSVVKIVWEAAGGARALHMSSGFASLSSRTSTILRFVGVT
jgi:hypothetical protein